MKITELYNRQKNIIKSGLSKRIDLQIPIDEARAKFYNDSEFKKFDIVESEGVRYCIIEKCSNYFQVANNEGKVFRKFAKQLTKQESVTPSEFLTSVNKELLEEVIANDGDLVALLKEESKMEFQSKDKLTIAKIIADACGVPHDVVSTPENLVSQAIQKAKKDSTMMKNKTMLGNMLQIAKDVGIKFSDTTFMNESGPSATYQKTPLAQAGSNRTTHDSEHEFMKHAKELHGDITKKNHEHHIAFHNKSGGQIGFATQKSHSDKNLTYVLHSKPITESAVLDELNRSTLASYSDKAKTSASDLMKQGSKSKSDKVSYKKFSQARDRFSNVAKADKKISDKDFNKKIGVDEAKLDHEQLANKHNHDYAMAIKDGDKYKAQSLKQRIEFHNEILKKKASKNESIEEGKRLNAAIVAGAVGLAALGSHVTAPSEPTKSQATAMSKSVSQRASEIFHHKKKEMKQESRVVKLSDLLKAD